MVGSSRALGARYLRTRECIARLARGRDDGQGMVEYALILVLIAIVVIVVLQVVGKQVNNVFSNISNGLSH
jgi:pilus assembly protein Flp/PilA